jgi:hypothetical protein
MLTQTNKTLCIDKNDKIEKAIARREGIETKRRRKRADGACNPGPERTILLARLFPGFCPEVHDYH